MANLFGGFFKQIEKPQDTHPPSVPQAFSQYDSEFVAYCIEQEQTLSNLEKEIHFCTEPKEIVMQTLKTACAFYAADWTGIIEVDLELGVTNTGLWHNPNPKIKTLQRMYEFENFFPMETWIKSIKNGQPIVILDINEVAKNSPQEYPTLKRLDVHNLIAVPFGPKPLGFLVLRNPARYNSFTSAARGFGYMAHRALAQQRTIDRVKMALTPEEIKSDKDIVINFFGDMEIITQDGVWKEHDFASPKCCRAAAYILLQRKTAHSALAIAEALYPEDTADVDTINKNIRGYISTNTWRVIFRYTDHTGKSRQSQKRGFATKREALAWERENANKLETKLDMTFGSFVEIYTEDMKNRVKENTWRTKEHIIESKILPHFQKRKIGEILPKDILAWQNAMLASKDNNGKPFSPSYLKTIHNQLSAIFNHACKFYGLTSNPAAKVGNMGKATTKEMQIWTQDEYRKFSEQTMDKPQFFYAFEMLYWCGIREGELLALTPADFDFKRQTVTINKSYQRFERRDVITDPKTPKSNRTIKMPDFLAEEMQDYLKMLYAIQPTDRIFTITKNGLHREMSRASAAAGVKRIRIHDLRHSHISLLIEMGFSAVAIGDRVGHESVDITYHYAHLFPSTQSNMADQLSAIRGGFANVS